MHVAPMPSAISMLNVPSKYLNASTGELIKTLSGTRGCTTAMNFRRKISPSNEFAGQYFLSQQKTPNIGVGVHYFESPPKMALRKS